jgi:membrane fusion protein, multidrug efflux system
MRAQFRQICFGEVAEWRQLPFTVERFWRYLRLGAILGGAVLETIRRIMSDRGVVGWVYLCAAAAAISGCAPKPGEVAPAEPLAVAVSQPVEREVTDFVDFTGRIDAKESVSVVPRVTGYLMSMPFKEGAEVKKDDILFQIDPRPYQAQYDQAAGQVLLNEARVKEAKADNARAQELAKTPGAIAKQDLDRYQAVEDEAIAALQAAKASLEVFKLDLGFCNVTSPIDGQVSRYFLTPGNLVNQDQTQLTTVVSVDPMYVYFDMDETTLLRIRTAINEGKIKRYERGEIPVFIGLEGEEGYRHQGTINFINNQVNAGTGSITVRGVIDNPKPENGIRLLSPGMFVRVRLPIGKPHEALLVIDRAIGSDQGLKYLYVVDDKNVVQQRRVQTGALQEDGLRAIDSGVKVGEWVVVGGIQQVRPRMQIKPDQEPMPVLGTAAAATLPTADTTGPAMKSHETSGADGQKPSSPSTNAEHGDSSGTK